MVKNFLKKSAEKLLWKFIVSSQPSIENYISRLRVQYKGISDDELAYMIVNRKSVKNGLIGALTSIGGVITLPVAIPANLVATWITQVSMILAIRCIYGYPNDMQEVMTDIVMIILGDSAKNTLKKGSVRVSVAMTEKVIAREMVEVVIEKYVAKESVSVLSDFIMGLIPFVGAPVGFAFDWVSTQLLGRAAIRFYKPQN